MRKNKFLINDGIWSNLVSVQKITSKKVAGSANNIVSVLMNRFQKSDGISKIPVSVLIELPGGLITTSFGYII